MTNPADDEKDSPEDKRAVQPTMVGGFLEFARANVVDSVAYLLLSASLFFCFFNPFAGSIPVGLIVGLYLSQHIAVAARQFRDFIVDKGIFRGFIVIAALAALIILAPGLCVGVLAGAFLRPFFTST